LELAGLAALLQQRPTVATVATVATQSLTILGHLLVAVHLVLVEQPPQELRAPTLKVLFTLTMGSTLRLLLLLLPTEVTEIAD
jgi:hypothetical protein